MSKMPSSAALLVEFHKVCPRKRFAVWTWDLFRFTAPLAAAVSRFLPCRLQARNVTISQPWQRAQSSLSALKNVHRKECPRNGNFRMWLKCSILTSVDGSWIFKHLCAFSSTDMKDVLLQKKLISWTVLFHSIVGINAPDHSTFWSGAHLQICQGATL